MVHSCIIANSNMYEAPRPPRRGSHRPAPVYPQALNDVAYEYELCDGFGGRSYRPPSQELEEPTGHEAPWFYDRPVSTDGWKQGRRLPATRYGSTARLTGETQRGLFSSRPLLDNNSQFDGNTIVHYSSPLSGMSPESGRSTTSSPSSVEAKVRSSLELMRQLHGGVADSDLIEKSIRESYARSAPQSAACQSVQKRCMYPDCTKISVSRGLCRGHGGGRRCHVPGCTKSAQSRSNFCWAHGGGQRCEADQCMRSRKSKRFCVSHLHLESSEAGETPIETSRGRARVGPDTAVAPPPESVKKTSAALPVRVLPSLGQALSSASRSAPNLPCVRGTRMYYREFCV